MRAFLFFVVGCLLTAGGLEHNAASWKAIGLDRAAHSFVFKKTLKVAIIDDGFDLDNPRWAANIAHNEADIPGNGVDDDHNGKTDDYQGWDFGDNDEDVKPAQKMVEHENHGTRVLGVFWQVLEELSAGDLSGIRILPIKAVADARLNDYLKEGYHGIQYAIDQKADIILCSWSGSLISAEEKAVLAKARDHGISIIASAGNFYALTPQYPGAVSSVINVAATDHDGKKLPVSNYGTFVDISAPGDSLATWNPYKRVPDASLNATSAAAPIIAAIVTAIRASQPGFTAEDAERLLMNTALPLEEKNPLYAGNLGAGLVNVEGIRDQLLSHGPASATAAHASEAAVAVFHQPKAFVSLRQLEAKRPVVITPAGKYQSIKFILSYPYPNPVSLPDLKVRVFRDGRMSDTIIRKERLKIPLLVTGDSVYVFRQGGGASGGARATSTGSAAKGWWSYAVTTIDSSTLYCNGMVTNVTGNEGYIEDGSGDASYTGRNDCKWQITAPAGKRLWLDFESFDTEPKLDQVYIFNGTSTRDPVLAIFSGHKLPPAIRSWGNTVLIWFLSSEENNYQGWKLHYKVID